MDKRPIDSARSNVNRTEHSAALMNSPGDPGADFDAAIKKWRRASRPVSGTAKPPVSTETREYGGWWDPKILKIHEELLELQRQGKLTLDLLLGWHRFVNSTSVDPVDWGNDLDSIIPPEIAPRLKQLLGSVHVELVPTLGTDLAAVSFTAPTKSWLLVAEDAIHSEDEVVFMVWHHLAHLTMGHLPFNGVGYRFEHRHEVVSHDVALRQQDPLYREEEARANIAASAMMYDEYVTQSDSEARSESILRVAVSSSQNERSLTRLLNWVTAPPMPGDDTRITLVTWAAKRYLTSALRPRLHFSGSIAVVRQQWWAPIYLVWVDESGKARRRWIPSRSVVHAIGLRLDHVGTMSQEDIRLFEYEGMLIRPADVAEVQSLLKSSVKRVRMGSAIIYRAGEILTAYPRLAEAKLALGFKKHEPRLPEEALVGAPRLRKVPQMAHVALGIQADGDCYSPDSIRAAG